MRVGLLVVLLGGCSSDGLVPPGEDPNLGSYETEITTDRPEVGLVQVGSLRCAGVLVTPYAVLTGAGCVGAGSPEDLGTFAPSLGSGVARTYAIDGTRTFGSDEHGGLALVHLAEPVPASAAVPARLAEVVPEDGETVARFGFDCLVYGPQDPTLAKRKYFFHWGQEGGACPSGVTFRGDGRVVQIEDGLSADVVDHAAGLRDQILAWPAPLEAGDESGLVAWWSFDNGYVEGPSGMAASFDGSDPMARPRPLLTHRTSWTWSAWVRPEAGGVLYSEGEPRVTLSIVLREDGAVALGAWHVETAEWISSVSSPALVPLGEWSHVAITLEAGGARAGIVSFYIDGRLTDKADGQAAVNPWTVFATLGDSVGAYYGGGQERAPYLGEMDELRVHDHAIDAGVLREYSNSAARQ